MRVIAQNDTIKTTITKQDEIKVFLDCSFCDHDYVKQEIPYVTYVRDQQEANLYIIITRQSTGSGGGEYTILFAGLKGFEFMNDIHTYISNSGDTENEIRAGITQSIKLALMRYIIKTSIAKDISITYQKPDEMIENTKKDPWDNWIFGTSVRGSFSGEESYKYQSLYSSVSADRVTEKNKFQVYAYYNYSESHFLIGDMDIVSETDSRYLSNSYVRSLGNHWSAGYLTNLQSSTYSNYKLRFIFTPAIEYNLFPYSESTSKQLRFMYSAGYVNIHYFDTTIFNKINENLARQSLDISLKVIKNWGSVTSSLNVSSYLPDIDKNRIVLYTELSIRIIKGLSFNLYGQFSSIHDQISLPKASASSEEILLQQRQLATQFSYYTSVGLSYTFGSMYNNIVNPRFGD
jgi:hypothetical protein